MVENKPQMRYSTEELSLLKATFAERDDLLKAIRKVFLQMDISEKEDIMIKGAMKENVVELLRRFFLPELEGDDAVGNGVDLWMTIKIDDKEPDQAKPHVMARQALISYMEIQLEVLANGGATEKLDFKKLSNVFNKDAEEMYMDLVARNTIIMHVQQQLMQIKLLAGTKEESPSETIERLHKDSSK